VAEDVTCCEGITGQLGEDGAATSAACVPTFPAKTVVKFWDDDPLIVDISG